MSAEDKLKELSNTLGDVEMKLAYRALDRSRGEAEAAYDFVNRAVEAGFADIDCGDCDAGDGAADAGTGAAADGQQDIDAGTDGDSE